jgi:hypothetical protein
MASTSAAQRALIYRRGSVYLATNSEDFSDNICGMLQGILMHSSVENAQQFAPILVLYDRRIVGDFVNEERPI